MSKFESVSKRSRVNALSFTLLLHHLMSGSYTYEKLAELTGLHHRTVRAWLAPMRKATPGKNGRKRLVRISGWEVGSDHRSVTPEFEWAPGEPDQPRPAPLTSAERARRCRANQRSLRLQQSLTLHP